MWHVTTPLCAAGEEGDVVQKRMTDPARCGTRRGVGRKRREPGCLNKNDRRSNIKCEVNEQTRKCTKTAKGKGPENEKKGEE